MRAILILTTILVIGADATRAQVQERKLIERLLEPDMSLQNSAQDKKFTAIESTTTTKQARTKSFYVAERPREKQFAGLRNFFTKIFATRRARDNDAKASLQTRGEVATPQIAAPASAYASARPAARATDTVAVSEFPDSSRKFLIRGKSQKALSQQDRPLTIDEVRELLNKNK